MTRYFVKITLALSLALLIYFIGMPGCSSVQFGSLDETLSCEDYPGIFKNCRTEPVNSPDIKPKPKTSSSNTQTPPPPSKYYVRFDYDVSLGEVDIIFVIDNSSSMAKEHRSLAKQFNSFLNQIRDVQYHIAVITTDISTSPENPVRNASYQDGRFIPIGGRMFLTNENLGSNPSSRIVEAFKQAIEREETKKCDNRNQPHSSGNQYDRYYEESGGEAVVCPSHDERGTYALNLAIQNQQHQSFFRKNAHLMVVILSDEDIRSSEEYYSQPGFDQYALEDYDYPEVFVQRMQERLGAAKSLSVHSIIIPPGDKACFDKQNLHRDQGHGTGKGYYGVQYARLSKARDPELIQFGNLLKGSVISICNRQYGYQLQKVAVSTNTIRVPLPCGAPESVDLNINGNKIRTNYEIEGRTLIMNPGKVSLNSRMHVQIICEE